MNLWHYLEQHVEYMDAKPLLRYRDRQWSYAQFHDDALRAARALTALGVRSHSAVCLMLGNSPDYLHLWFGLARIGAVKVPINIHLKGEGLAYILNHSEAEILIIEANLLPQVLDVVDATPRLRTIVVRGEVPSLTSPCLSLSEVLVHAEGPCPLAATDPEAVHSILYTSGTTGPPKGVMLSHQAYLNSAAAFAGQFVHLTPDDILYTCLPLFHINAQAHTVLPAIGSNATIALGDRFSARGFWEEIRSHQATVFNSLAAMIPILWKQPPTAQDRNHGARLTACAATPTDVWRPFEERFGVRIIEGYGLTETAGFCINNPPDRVRIGSIGVPMSFVDVRIVDHEGKNVDTGYRGELLLRSQMSHAFMDGYFKMPNQTAEAMRDGWIHSGDMVSADPDGYLRFVDRIKQSIRRRGENISSWEVEQIVDAHPQVLESAAVGVPSELGEEEVKICVVLRPGVTLDPVDIVRWCETRMAYFMVPRYVELRETLPKTATERIEKYKLKEEGTTRAWDREAAGYVLNRA
jgi:crotonobetaine/carnitine-CoA ligase